jgi:hypothetical protein
MTTTLSWSRGALSVRWCGGAVLVTCGPDAILLDAPPDLLAHLPADALPRIRAVLVTSGRPRSVGGLVPLWCALLDDRATDAPLPLHAPLGEERSAALADAFSRGWPDAWSVPVDSAVPGEPTEIGPFLVHATSIGIVEPTPRRGFAREVSGVALAVQVDGARIVFAAGATNGGALKRALRDADLAIVEVGVRPWSVGGAARLDPAAAAALTHTCADVWLVGDDGAPVSAGGEQ